LGYQQLAAVDEVVQRKINMDQILKTQQELARHKMQQIADKGKTEKGI
jgi:hypothetical protein